MKRPLGILVVLLIINASRVSAQICTGDFFFQTQTDSDQFIIDNPSCTEILGNVYIDMNLGPDPLMNLNGLQNITTITGQVYLYVHNSGIGVSLLGLSNLTSIIQLHVLGEGEPFSITGLDNIQDISYLYINASSVIDLHPFDNLSTIVALDIDFNVSSVTNPTMDFHNVFPNLETIEYALTIGMNSSQCDTLTGFNALTSLESLSIGQNSVLETSHFDGFHSLVQIEYGFHSNAWYTASISGFENLEFVEYLELSIYCLCELPEFSSLYNVGSINIFSHAYSFPDFPSLIVTNSDVLISGSTYTVGFINLETVHGDLTINPDPFQAEYELTDIMMDSLRIVDGQLSILGTNIDNLDFLANLETVGSAIDIMNNTNLTDCEIHYLCQQIPISPEMFTINNNGPGCSSLEQVQASCGSSFISGEVYFDLDCDGVFNNNDAYVPNPIILNENNSPVGGSNSSGYYITILNDNTTTTITPQGFPGFSTTPQTFTTSNAVESFTNVNFPLCPQSEIHNLSISVTNEQFRPGFYTWYTVYIHNYGIQSEDAIVTLTLTDMPGVSVNSATENGAFNGDTITWNVADIPALGVKWVSVYFHAEASTPLGQQLTTTVDVAINPSSIVDLDLSDNSLVTVNTVIGSYDPNDITVNIPAYDYAQLQVEETIPLDYTIRFQNTGTAEAVNVRVVNPIDEKLDLSTFELIQTSHAATLHFNENNELEWIFENIMLPDSNSNEEESHGFIQYRIRTQPGLIPQDIIESTAAIYFDFNEPIITNTATTEIYECPEALVITEEGNICEGFSLIALATYGWDNYNWTIDGTPSGTGLGITLENVVPGDYILICEATTEFCEASYSYTATIIDTPDAPIITQNGNTLTASGSGEFQWMYNEEDMMETGNTIEMISSGDYGVYVTNNGCSSPQTTGYYIFTSVEETLDLKSFVIIPNPMHHNSMVSMNAVIPNATLLITDLLGKKVKEINIHSTNIHLTNEGLESGVYFVSLKNEQEKVLKTLKLVVE